MMPMTKFLLAVLACFAWVGAIAWFSALEPPRIITPTERAQTTAESLIFVSRDDVRLCFGMTEARVHVNRGSVDLYVITHVPESACGK